MLRIAGALGLALALVIAVVAVGHGDDRQLGNGDLVWQEQPHVYRNPQLPHDRVLRGVIRNDSVRIIMLSARELGVRTAGGAKMESATVFAPTFIRGVFPQNRGDAAPESEQLRVGLRARLEPGKAVPITVSWREHGERAALVDYGSGSLPVPRGG
jgi:hypothetical protein